MSIGIWQVVLILLIVLIVFGAGKLPKVMGDVAKGVKNFRSGLKDDGDDGADNEPAKSPTALPQSGEASTVTPRSEVKDEVAKT